MDAVQRGVSEVETPPPSATGKDEVSPAPMMYSHHSMNSSCFFDAYEYFGRERQPTRDGFEPLPRGADAPGPVPGSIDGMRGVSA